MPAVQDQDAEPIRRNFYKLQPFGECLSITRFYFVSQQKEQMGCFAFIGRINQDCPLT